MKKWIAHSHDFVKGSLIVNSGAARSLLDPSSATSLLPVGITEVTGAFEKGDLVRIADEQGADIGLGCCEYTSDDLRKLVGVKDCRPAIHYDYLYIEN